MRLLLFTFIVLSIGCATPQSPSPPSRQPVPEISPPDPVVVQIPTLVMQKAPDFKAEAVMPDGSFSELSLSSYQGKYVVLFFYPLDFTVVCPTEIVAFNDLLDLFESSNCQVLGMSADSKYSHLAWRNTPRKNGGIGTIRYPLLSDITKEICRKYGVLHGESVSLRGLFIIDPKGIVRHALINDMAVGRNIDEVYRTLMAIQLIDAYGEFCPANWKPGDPGITTARDYMKEYLRNKK